MVAELFVSEYIIARLSKKEGYEKNSYIPTKDFLAFGRV